MMRYDRLAGGLAAVVIVLVATASRADAQGRLTLPAGAVSVVAGMADHRVDAGAGRERTSGPLFGAQLEIEPADRMTISLRGLGGTLGPDRKTPAAEARGFGELALATRIDVLTWFRGTAAAVARSYDGSLARQRWGELAVGGEGHAALIDGVVDGTIGLSLAPIVRVTGRDGPDLAIAGTARLRHVGERLDLALAYTLQRYNFPGVNGVQRVEELSVLVFRAGLRIGGPRSRR